MTYHIPTERIDALALAATEGRVIREDWRQTGADGREMACTLGWLGDDIEDPSECPAEYMPRWLAYLVPECNDRTGEEGFAVWLDRIPGILRRISAVPDDVWPVLERRAKARAVVEAMRHTGDEFALAACREVLRLLRDGGTAEEFTAAYAAAWAAADAAARASVWAAADAAGSAAEAAKKAAEGAAYASIDAADAADAAAQAADAAQDTTWDRMTNRLLDDLDNATQGRDIGPFPTEPAR